MSKILHVWQNSVLNNLRIIGLALICWLFVIPAYGSKILIPMDKGQANHLKAYGIAYWVLDNQVEIDWLLNYRGGSFMMQHYQKFENELIIRGISYEVVSDAQANMIVQEIASAS